ncbi:peptide chain release factor-like protein [Candidatus Vidania fulgoroideorum]
MKFKKFFLSISHFKGGKDSKDCLNIILNQYIKFFKKKKINYYFIIKEKNKNLIKKIIMKIKSKKNIKFILNENGINKIIRRSPFKKNSTQTSFCSVMFYPIAKKKNFYIDKKNLLFFYSKSSKPGGQNVNKTNSAVRITHIKTGISVKCERERSQYMNKKIALKILKFKINKHLIKKDISINKNINRIYFMNKSLVINKKPRIKTKNILNILKGNIDFFYSK